MALGISTVLYFLRGLMRLETWPEKQTLEVVLRAETTFVKVNVEQLVVQITEGADDVCCRLKTT